MQLNDNTNLIGILQDLYFNGHFNASTYSRLDLNRIVNKYYHMLQEDLRGVNEDFFLISSTATLPLYSTNNGTFTLPLGSDGQIDCEKIKSIWVAINPASPAAPQPSEFVRVTIIDANAITDPSYVFTNPTAVMFGAYFVTYPQFTDTTIFPVTGGMKLYYIQRQVDLVNDTDVPNILPDYHDAITAGALIDIARRQRDYDLLAEAKQTFKDRRAEMKADAAQRVLDIEPAYVEGQSSQGGWYFSHGQTGL
jgi:hypothetical protein